jgi:hypothetical protein
MVVVEPKLLVELKERDLRQVHLEHSLLEANLFLQVEQVEAATMVVVAQDIRVTLALLVAAAEAHPLSLDTPDVTLLMLQGHLQDNQIIFQVMSSRMVK